MRLKAIQEVKFKFTKQHHIPTAFFCKHIYQQWIHSVVINHSIWNELCRHCQLHRFLLSTASNTTILYRSHFAPVASQEKSFCCQHRCWLTLPLAVQRARGLPQGHTLCLRRRVNASEVRFPRIRCYHLVLLRNPVMPYYSYFRCFAISIPLAFHLTQPFYFCASEVAGDWYSTSLTLFYFYLFTHFLFITAITTLDVVIIVKAIDVFAIVAAPALGWLLAPQRNFQTGNCSIITKRIWVGISLALRWKSRKSDAAS